MRNNQVKIDGNDNNSLPLELSVHGHQLESLATILGSQPLSDKLYLFFYYIISKCSCLCLEYPQPLPKQRFMSLYYITQP
ncbi:hypothetical protein PRUPE_5G030500 [Prunus persica]|uniref:Uncharacterized protein n=1 Tax=Prunus persica TaxID=3760 RepID=A0A251P319_PRUPE|nr:hypothetical protein PRUPE_5G030500 [Prunus persica]